MNKTLALPERLPERGSNAPLGEIGLKIDAEYLELAVEAVAGLARATAELTGPQEVLDRIQETHDGPTWSLRWPRDGRNRGGGGITIQSGGFQSVSFGSGRAGRTIINGVDVTDLINGVKGEPLRATFRVPARSAVQVKVDAGQVHTSGQLAGVIAETVSADVCCKGQVGQLSAMTISGDIEADETGPSTVSSTSGDIELGAAHGVVQAQTVSGDIQVHAVEPVFIHGKSVSGDVRITAAPGVRPIATGKSVSGKVRLPH